GLLHLSRPPAGCDPAVAHHRWRHEGVLLPWRARQVSACRMDAAAEARARERIPDSRHHVMDPRLVWNSTKARMISCRSGSCAVVSLTGRSSGYERRSPLATNGRAGKVT